MPFYSSLQLSTETNPSAVATENVSQVVKHQGNHKVLPCGRIVTARQGLETGTGSVFLGLCHWYMYDLRVKGRDLCQDNVPDGLFVTKKSTRGRELQIFQLLMRIPEIHVDNSSSLPT
jgi:hypothetical protein